MKCDFKVNRISRDEVVGVPVPTYLQSKNQLSDTSLNWFYSANEKAMFGFNNFLIIYGFRIFLNPR